MLFYTSWSDQMRTRVGRQVSTYFFLNVKTNVKNSTSVLTDYLNYCIMASSSCVMKFHSPLTISGAPKAKKWAFMQLIKSPEAQRNAQSSLCTQFRWGDTLTLLDQQLRGRFCFQTSSQNIFSNHFVISWLLETWIMPEKAVWSLGFLAVFSF